MIRRVLLAVFLCGITSGLFLGVLQMWRLTPLVLQAELYEPGEDAHPHNPGNNEQGVESASGATGSALSHVEDSLQHPAQSETQAHVHDAAAWVPADGFERTASTFVATMVVGVAWAALLAGTALLTNIPLNRRNGAIWGLCGFVAAALAPSIGLPPELPGMPVGDLGSRQAWWLVTVGLAAAAMVLLARPRRMWSMPLAVLLFVVPQLVGAPQPLDHAALVPAGLAASFVANSLGLSAVFWVLTGTMLGKFFEAATHKDQLT